MDVDVGGTPEPENMGADDMARDGESDLVVQQLDRGLPRWEGQGDLGWLKEKEGSEDHRLEFVLAIKGHKDAVYVSPPLLPLPALILSSGNRYATALEAMPEETNIPYLSFSVCLWALCCSVLTACLTFSVSISVPSVAENDRGLSPSCPVAFLLISGVEPCAFQCLRVQQSI